MVDCPLMNIEKDIGFVGTFEHQLDEKKRLSVPSDFRKLLETGSDGKINLYIRKEDGMIQVFTPEGVALMTQKYREESIENPRIRERMRRLGSSFQRKILDAQGRIMLPEDFIAYASLQRDAVIVGAMGWFEIWSKEVWDSLPDQIEESYHSPGG